MNNNDVTESSNDQDANLLAKRHQVRALLADRVESPVYSLSSGQSRIWLASEFSGGDGAYNVNNILKIEGTLSVSAFEKAVQHLVSRHESLRTSFPFFGDTPLASVASHGVADIVVDESETPIDDALRVLGERAGLAFDIERGPVLRAQLMATACGKTLILFSMPHIVADGWSVDVLIRDFIASYKKASEESASEAMPVAVPFSVFASSEKDTLQDIPDLAKSHWISQLRMPLPRTQWPTVGSKLHDVDVQPETRSFNIGRTELMAIDGLCAELGITRYMYFLGAFAIGLRRYGGDDILIGSPVSNRDDDRFQNTLGYLSNTLPIRLGMDGSIPMRAFLGTLRQTVVTALDVQDIPFDSVTSSVHGTESGGRFTLFQALFVLQQGLGSDLKLGELKTTVIPVDSAHSKSDVTLHISDMGNELLCRMETDPSQVSADVATDLVDIFRHVVDTVVSDPDLSINNERYLPARIRNQLTSWSGADNLAEVHKETISMRFDSEVALHPGKVAVTDSSSTWTYAQLDHLANALASVLVDIGVQEGERVGVALPRGVSAIVSFLGILKIGAAFVPLDPEYPRSRLEMMIRDSSLITVICEAEFETLGMVDTRLIFDLQALLKTPAGPKRVFHTVNSTAYVMYTSGSTGVPKGVEVRQQSVLSLVNDLGSIGLSSESVFLHASPIVFDAAIFDIFVSLLNGASIVLLPSGTTDLDEVVHAIENNGVTALFLTAALMQQLSSNQIQRMRGLEVLITGGDVLSPRAAKRMVEGVPNLRLFNAYGPTETTVFATLFEVSACHDWATALPIGRPLRSTQAYVLDADGALVLPGVAGELHLGGDGLGVGYLNQPDLTDAKFVHVSGIADGTSLILYKTGDVVHWDLLGNLNFLGRSDRQVKVRGFRIESGEVQFVLDSLISISTSYVTAVGEGADKQLAAYFVLADRSTSVKNVRREASDILPEYMMPTFWIPMDRMPLRESGKVAVEQLPDPREMLSHQSMSPEPAQTDVEHKLGKIWEGVLGLQGIGMTGDFFELGGDSIRGIQIVAAARREGLSLRPRDILKFRTIRKLANHISNETEDNSASVASKIAIAVVDPRQSPIQAWFDEQDLPDRDRFTMSQVFEIAGDIDRSAVTAALSEVMRIHPALHPIRGGNTIGALSERHRGPIVDYLDLSDVEPAQHDVELISRAALIQGTINIESGTVLRALFVERGPLTNWLLVTIHHLAVDSVSWQIIGEDLTETFVSLANGAVPSHLLEITSGDEWTTRLQQLADSTEFGPHADYWIRIAKSRKPMSMPVSPEAGRNDRASTVHYETSLDRAQTQLLLGPASAAYDTQVNDLLLTALLLAAAPWSDASGISIALEGHGREDIDPSIDLSRTVGWFTSLFPVNLDLPTTSVDIEAAILAVKANLRAVPLHGLSYGIARYMSKSLDLRSQLAKYAEPQISFNYMGVTAMSDVAGVLRPIPVIVPSDRQLEGDRSRLLEVNASVEGGELRVVWSYSANVFEPAAIQQLATSFTRSLERVVEECTAHEHSIARSGFQAARHSTDDLGVLAEDIDLFTSGEIVSVWPTSGAQEGMVYHSLADQGSGTYLVQWEADFDGHLDGERLALAFQNTVNSHDALKVTFKWGTAGAPLQLVHRKVVLPVEYIDWSRLSSEEVAENQESHLQSDRARGFDYETAPLMRLAVIRVSGDITRVIWTYHHALMDGWTFSLVLGEVREAYLSPHSHSGAVERRSRTSLRDHLEQVSREDLANDEQFWSGHMSGTTGPTTLPIEFASTSCINSVFREQQVRLGPEKKRYLMDKAQRMGISLNTLCLGGWALTLSRHSGEDSVTIGVTGSGRSGEVEDVDKIVGLFISTLPMRVQCTQGTVRDWLSSIQESQWEMREHEHNSLEEIRNWTGVPNHVPLFDHIFVFENYPDGPEDQDNWNGALLVGKRSHERTNYPLNVAVKPDSELVLEIGYDALRFTDESVRVLLEHYSTALVALADEPDAFIEDVVLSTEVERRDLIRTYAPAYRTPDERVTIHSLFEEQALRNPNAVAVTYKATHLTYGQLDTRANELADGLLNQGIGSGSFVGICTTRCVEMMVGILGILKSGAAYVPISHKYPAERIAQIADQANIAAFVTRRDLADPLPELDMPVMYLEDYSAGPGMSSLSQKVTITSADPCYVYFTSGSTGTPKGVLVTHGSLVSLHLGYREVYRLERDTSVHLQMSNMSFDLFTADWTRALCAGQRMVLCPPELLLDGAALFDLIEREKVDYGEFIPVVLRALVDYVESSGRDLHQFRIIVAGADVWYGEEYTRIRGLCGPQTRLINGFGVTEATIDNAMFEDTELILPGGRPVPVSRPFPNQQLYVIDHMGKIAPTDVPGELCIGGVGVAEGYINAPDKNATQFVPCSFDVQGGRMYKTGDVARYSSAGFIELGGRIDGQVKIRGFRIELGEVERNLKKHPDIADVAAIVQRHGDVDDAVLVAYVVTKGGAVLSPSDLIRFMKTLVPWFMVPGAFVEIPKLPLNANNKLDRNKLPAPSVTRPDVDGTLVPPTGALEVELVELWRNVLRLDNVGVTDNLIDLGGSSLRAMRIAADVQRHHGLAITIRDVLLYPTIREFCDFLKSVSDEALSQHG